MVRRSFVFCLTLFFGAAHAQTCTTTLSAGAAVGTSISSAASGDVICLNDGNYSGFTLNNVSKSPRVTVRAVNSGSATFTSQLSITGSTSGLTFDGIDYTQIRITGATVANLTFKNGDASAGTIEIDGVTTTTPNILFENLTHYDQDKSGFCHGATVNCVGNAAYYFSYSGRSTPVATIRGALIDGGCADGVETGVPFILEYSTLINKLVGSCVNDPHTDATQLYGYPFNGTIIRYNYYYNNAQVVAAYDSLEGILVEHNVMDPGTDEPRACQIELYSDDGSIVRNNTLIIRGTNGRICLSRKPAIDDVGINTEIYNNIAYSIDQDEGSTASVNTKNLVPGGGGTNITGTATFEGTCQGGASNWRNCALTSGSTGHNAGTDSKDVGTRFYGVRKPTGLN
jgi:hypothetical protein